MKRLIFPLILILIPIASANADSSVVITEPTHRNAEGVFLNDELALGITPEGRLGRLLFDRNASVNTFTLDVGTLEEIQDLADGYSYIDANGETIEVPELLIAEIFLSTLRSSVVGKKVLALPYGNPDKAFLVNRSQSEYEYLKRAGVERLTALLALENLEVRSTDSLDLGGKASKSAKTLSDSYRRDLRAIFSIAPAPEVASLRLQLGQLLNPSISKVSSIPLYESLAAALKANESKLKIARGNYTITTSNYDLPVTVINNYSIPLSVELIARPTNSRIVVGSAPNVTIPANSQSQVEIPLKIIASGDTQIELKLHGLNGRQVGEVEYIPLRLAVISPLTTWFTTGMAIILLLAAVIQSMRRVKKRKKL